MLTQYEVQAQTKRTQTQFQIQTSPAQIQWDV